MPTKDRREILKLFASAPLAAGFAFTEAQAQTAHDHARKASPERSAAVAFFNAFRDLTAAGFWSSKMGVQDIGFRGNTFVADWQGCPPDVLKKIGIDA